MNIEKFKTDHIAMLSAVNDIRQLVRGGVVPNANALAEKIVFISASIKLHLASEDKYLYPTMSKSADPSIALASTQFQSEMNGIAAAYLDFAGKWNLGSRVAANPEGFKDHANTIFKALYLRIQREDRELYPLAEKA